MTRPPQRACVGGDLDVNVRGGTVAVSGTAPSESDERRVVKIVQRTFGVDEVRAQLPVNPAAVTTAPGIPDSEVSQRVAPRIARAPIPAGDAARPGPPRMQEAGCPSNTPGQGSHSDNAY